MEDSATTSITATELWRGLASGTLPGVLDLRNPDDAAVAPFEGPLGTKVVAVPLWSVLDDPEAVASDIEDGTVALCAKGNGSQMVAEMLAEHGRRVLSLDGGTAAWARTHLPVEVTLPGRSPVVVWQILRPAKGCLSYVVGVPGGGAVVIDPSRFADPYLELTRSAGLRVAAVVDTHLHADHISGGPALAARLGVPYYLSDDEIPGVDQDARGEEPPESVILEGPWEVSLVRIPLPGHTPGTIAVALPGVFLAAGDTLFRGGVGRPDLTGQADELARELFTSIHERLADMPPETLVLPAHWSAPEEIGPDGTVATTLGDLVAFDRLAGLDVDEFVAAVTSTLRPAPATYDRIRDINAGAFAGDDELEMLEVGRNQCAASMPPRS